VSDEFEDPGALKLDFKGSAYVLNNDTELRKLDSRPQVGGLREPAGGCRQPGHRFAGNISCPVGGQCHRRVDAYCGDSAMSSSPHPDVRNGLAVHTERQRYGLLADLWGGIREIDGAAGTMQKHEVSGFPAARMCRRRKPYVVVASLRVMQKVHRSTSSARKLGQVQLARRCPRKRRT